MLPSFPKGKWQSGDLRVCLCIEMQENHTCFKDRKTNVNISSQSRLKLQIESGITGSSLPNSVFPPSKGWTRVMAGCFGVLGSTAYTYNQSWIVPVRGEMALVLSSFSFLHGLYYRKGSGSNEYKHPQQNSSKRSAQ